MATKSKSKKQKSSYTNTKGQKVTNYTDGTKTVTGKVTNTAKIGDTVNGKKVKSIVGGDAYASSKDTLGYNDTFEGKGIASSGIDIYGNSISPMSAETLMSTEKKMGLPTKPQGSTLPYDMGQINTMLGADKEGSFQKNIQDYMNSLANIEQPSAEKLQKNLMKETGVNDARKEFNRLQGQLEGITTSSQAQQLSLEGQGRGQTSSFVGGEQARIAREAAIQALPIQGQLAMAQGNLELAQQTFNSLYSARLQDAQAEYQFKTNIIGKVFDYANASETRRLSEIQRQEDRKYDMEKTNLNYVRDLTEQAIVNGNTNAIALLSKIKTDSPTFEQDVANAAKLIQKPVEASGGGVPTGYSSSPYSGVVDTILASGRFTKDQANAVRQAIASGQDPQAVIKNNAKLIMGSAEADKVSNLEVAKDTLSQIETQLKEFYRNGGTTGLFTGNYEKVINKLGDVDNPNLVSLATQIQGNLQIYRNAVSGTAYSVQEGVDIASIFPGINKSQGLNDAIIKGRIRDFDNTIDSRYRSVLGTGYDLIKQPGQSETQVTSPVTQEELNDIDFNPQPTGFLGGIKKFFSGLF